METNKKYKAIDFFCGGGGMTCGLRQAGIDVIAGVDFDKDAKKTYEYNNKGSKFVMADINELPENYFEEQFDLKKNGIIPFCIALFLHKFYENRDKKVHTHLSRGSISIVKEFLLFLQKQYK